MNRVQAKRVAFQKISQIRVAERFFFKRIQKKACVIAHINADGGRVLF